MNKTDTENDTMGNKGYLLIICKPKKNGQWINWDLCGTFSQPDSVSGVACIKFFDNLDLPEEF